MQSNRLVKIYRQTLIKKNLELRSRVIQAIRIYFQNHGYLEVETPCRIPAPAPEAYIDAEVSGSWFLQTSPELCMKRLIAAGYPRIFQICRCFRQNERGSRHLPEFTLLEWYCTHCDYRDLMDQCEDLIQWVACDTGSKDAITYQGERIELSSPWQRMSVAEAFDAFASVAMDDALLSDTFDEVMACEIEPNLGRQAPLFLYDYPASKGALARLKPADKSLAERFELYISGLELCNAFTELIDADEQSKRFEVEKQERNLAGKCLYPNPEKFLKALKNMPESSGNALGIDRLVMLFADSIDIDAVVAFGPEEL